jgi:hypothetical protein
MIHARKFKILNSAQTKTTVGERQEHIMIVDFNIAASIKAEDI